MRTMLHGTSSGGLDVVTLAVVALVVVAVVAGLLLWRRRSHG
jgi:hypothetical protein